MKNYIAHISLLALGLTACGGLGSAHKDGTTPTTGPTIVGDPNTPTQDSNAFPYTLVGRFDTSNPNKVRFDWSNSSIGATFTGSSLSVNLADESTNMYAGTMPVQNLFDVVIDNGTPQVLQIVAKQGSYPLATGLAAGTHTVWLHKRTEPQIGISDFSGFVLAADGNFLTPPLPPTRTIEVIGDSGATGYGADANVTAATMCGFTAATENADFSYPKLLADTLQASLTNLSFSGKGISRNITADDNITMPILAARSVASDNNSTYTQVSHHDVVIIDGGGDDLVGDYGSGVIDLPSFNAAYVALIQKVRADNPNAVIIGALTAGAGGGDVATLGNAIKSSVTLANTAGDPNVFYFAFTGYDGSVGYGCDYHPNHAAAALLANQILPLIKSKTGW